MMIFMLQTYFEIVDYEQISPLPPSKSNKKSVAIDLLRKERGVKGKTNAITKY